MKVRVVLSALVLAFSIPALAATAGMTKTGHTKKHHAAVMHVHSAKGKSEAKHHEKWHHKAKESSKYRHHHSMHKTLKKHSNKKSAAGGGKKHPKPKK